MMTCSKLYVTKIKYSKSWQSQRTKGEIKTSFNFTVIICKYVSKSENVHPAPLKTRHKRVTINYRL